MPAVRRASVFETPLPWLQGTWRGQGKGIFPTIKDFQYNEEIVVKGDTSNPRPVLHYKQRTCTTHAVPKPMHEETGFIRVLMHSTNEEGLPRVEWILSAPNGVHTIEEGTLNGTKICLKSTSIGRSSTARPPHCTAFERVFTVDLTHDPPTLHYTMDMATTTTPTMTRHLEAWLVKVTDLTPLLPPIATMAGCASFGGCAVRTSRRVSGNEGSQPGTPVHPESGSVTPTVSGGPATRMYHLSMLGRGELEVAGEEGSNTSGAGGLDHEDLRLLNTRLLSVALSSSPYQSPGC